MAKPTWTVIKITVPGRYKRLIKSDQGAMRAPTADEIAANPTDPKHIRTPDRHSYQIVGLDELPALKARLEKGGRTVTDEGQAPAKGGGD